MKIRMGLRAKFTCLFILCAGLILVVFYKQFDEFYTKSVMRKYIDIASSTANSARMMLDAKRIEKYLDTKEKDEEYEVVEKGLVELKRASGANYLYVFRLTEDSMEYVYDIELPEEKGLDIAEFGEKCAYNPKDYQDALEVERTQRSSHNLEVTETDLGYLASAYAPIINSSRKVVALVGVDIDMNQIIAEKNRQSRDIMRFCGGVVAICFGFLLLIVHVSVIRPIRRLKRDVNELADGKLGVQTKLSGNNEITEIASVFNRMSINIENHIRETEGLNQAYYKFVPSEIIQILKKQSVTQLKLGDEVNTKLAVLSLVTDQFDELIRNMGNEEIFRFINDILYNCVPVITSNHGVVEQFENAGLTAFYTKSDYEVLDSTITILGRIAKMNQTKGFGISQKVKICCGITYDSVKVGIVGHEERMSAMTISEQRWITKFLSGIAAAYHASLLVTATFVASIQNFEERYDYRFLGFIRLSRNCVEKIYDVFNGDEEEDRILKMQTKALFEEGVKLYCAKKFADARLEFVEVLRQYRKDSAASRYLYLCNQNDKKENKDEIDIAIEIM